MCKSLHRARSVEGQHPPPPPPHKSCLERIILCFAQNCWFFFRFWISNLYARMYNGIAQYMNIECSKSIILCFWHVWRVLIMVSRTTILYKLIRSRRVYRDYRPLFEMITGVHEQCVSTTMETVNESWSRVVPLCRKRVTCWNVADGSRNPEREIWIIIVLHHHKRMKKNNRGFFDNSAHGRI